MEMIMGSALFTGMKDIYDQLERIFWIMGTPNEASWPGVESLKHYRGLSEGRFGQHRCRRLHRVAPRLLGIQHAEALALRFLQMRPEQRISAAAAMRHAYFQDLPAELHDLAPDCSVFSLAGIKMAPEVSTAATTPVRSASAVGDVIEKSIQKWKERKKPAPNVCVMPCLGLMKPASFIFPGDWLKDWNNMSARVPDMFSTIFMLSNVQPVHLVFFLKKLHIE